MNRLNERPAAAERGRWLAELAQAVDQAQQLARSFSTSQDNCPETEELVRRLEAMRIEVDDLRRGGWGARPAKIDPLWSSLFSWPGRQEY